MSDTSNHPMHELLEEYALGALNDAERAAFESRLAEDVELQRDLAATLEALGMLALSTPAAVPSALKQRVMARIADVAPPHESRVQPICPPLM